MKHESKFEEMLMLYHFGELSEMESKIFQSHLKTCEKCQRELADLQQMNGMLIQEPEEMPSMDLVNRANREIMKKLDSESSVSGFNGIKDFFNEITDSFAQLFAQPKFQLSGMAATLLIGILVGKIWMSSGIQNNPDMMIQLLSNSKEISAEQYNQFQKTLASTMLKSGNVEVEDFLNGDNVSEDGIMSVSYKLKNNFEVQGGLDDPTVRDMLLYAARKDENPTRRLRAINMLSTIGMNEKIEETFSAVILHDTDDQIRLKAAEILGEHQLCEKSLESFKSVALRDTSSGMRLKAIEVLKKQNAENMETVFAVMASRDRDDAVKEAAQKALEEINSNN